MMTATQTTQTAPSSMDAPAAYIGWDWGHKEHAMAVEIEGKVELCTLSAQAESVHEWLRGLRERVQGRKVVVGVEASKGPIINALLEHNTWLVIHPVNPATSARYRKAFIPSGAKDDLPDAGILLELVRDHMNKLRPRMVADEQTAELEALTALRRNLVDQRSGLTNQLDALLKSYFPQALELIGEKHSPMALAFLKRWPDLLSLKRAKASTLKKFYYEQNSRSTALIEERLRLIDKAESLTTNELTVSVGRLKLKALLALIEPLNKHIKSLEQRIAAAFKLHPDHHLFANLPGAGKSMAPRLCAAFSSDRSFYPNAVSLQKIAGVAPVREKSGQRVWTHWRWQAPVFLRQTFVEWAGLSVQYSSWAAAYYEQMEKKGKPRAIILRSLAFKWIRVLWRCWQDNEIYDEARYLQQLQRRNSPYASRN